MNAPKFIMGYRVTGKLPNGKRVNVRFGWGNGVTMGAALDAAVDALARAGVRDIVINTAHLPQQFEDALKKAKAFVEGHKGGHKVLTINSWNEWTEGSYLEPDTVHGMKYLEAMRDVFGQK